MLAEYIASAPLTPLLKPDNGIRPIAVGAIWRRLVSKVAMKKVGKEVKYLGDFQFGVGIPNGVEAVLHSANRFLDSFHDDGSLAMLTVDFSNAFNAIDRTTLLCYGKFTVTALPFSRGFSFYMLSQLGCMWGLSVLGPTLGFSKGALWGPCSLL